MRSTTGEFFNYVYLHRTGPRLSVSLLRPESSLHADQIVVVVTWIDFP